MSAAATRAVTAFAAAITLVLTPAIMGPSPAAHAAVTVTDWGALATAFETGGSQTIVLGATITSPTTEALALESGDNVTLDLNGYALTVGDPNEDGREEGAYGAGIGVPHEAALTIHDNSSDGSGQLNAYGGELAAGIGGTSPESAGSINAGSISIEGGNITAMGGRTAAGIGGGQYGGPGTVLITGGVVTAEGGFQGPGIGRGLAPSVTDSPPTDAGSVTIAGGIVSAAGTGGGAGIGGGTSAWGVKTTITGGTVTATGKGYAAGIGGGMNGGGSAVTISGGQVKASGGAGYYRGASIGAGGAEDGSPAPGTLTLLGNAVGTVPTAHQLQGLPRSAGAPHRQGLGAAVSVGAGEMSFEATPSESGTNPTVLNVQFGGRVVFNAVGGTPDPATKFILEGKLVDEPAVDLAGHVFMGWQVGTATGEAWDFDTDTVTADLTLVASWEPDTPTNTTPPTISGTPEHGSTLTAAPGMWDLPDLTYSYQWYRDETPIAGASTADHIVTADDLTADLTVAVTASRAGDTRYTPASATSDVLLIPGDITPVAAPEITGTPELGSTLVASTGTWDLTVSADEPALTYTYQWQRDGTPITDANAADYTVTGTDLAADLTVTVTAAHSRYTPAVATSTTLAVPPGDITNIDTPEISGTPVLGESLTASFGAWSLTDPADEPDLVYSYRWQRDGAPIAEATTSNYTVTPDDLAADLSVTVTATHARYTSTAATSDVLLIPGDILNLVAPKISGTPVLGATLTASTGEWSPSNPADEPDLAYTYQWQRDGAPITDATAAEYTVTGTDLGADLTVTVTVTHTSYSPANATSAALTVPSDITMISAPALTGTPGVGHLLSVTAGTWSPAPLRIEYSWYRDGTPIADAVEAGYLVTAADEGSQISVEVTVHANGYPDQTFTVAPLQITAQPATLPSPVGDSAFTDANRGGITATTTGTQATLTLPTALHERWLYVYGHSTPTPLGWHHAAGGTITVDISALSPGPHRLAVHTVDGAFVGWAPITILALPNTGQSSPTGLIALAAAVLLAGAGTITIAATRRGRPSHFSLS